ncbi:prostatic acid phosphatase-like [Coccinella septempunctata]|uniref:prostatic acid phosphatase-like n=1 Tax=Coccinella septempunctata TaxID=41139 RepID=UPI001D074375|nr:prostatic acid phosphatase-like [Coccinella septempunctata]
MYALLLFTSAIIYRCYGDDTLISAVVIFRHGARTPVDPYPNDPYRSASFWPAGFGQLTNEGKEQQFQLGQWFRKRYADFMPAEYSEKDIYVRSTDVDRTLMSAEANLAGFYPPQKEFHPGLAWQPIPVHTIEETKDEVLAMKRPCPKYSQLLEELFKQPFFLNISHTYQYLYAYLTRYSGTLVNNPDEVEYLYNTLTIEKSFNYTLPAWTEKVYPEKMEYLASLSFALDAYTPQLARLKAGPLFHLISEHFINFSSMHSYEHHNHSRENVWNRKFLMFSAHDTTIANVLNSMGLFDMHSPPFAATIIFELRQRVDNSTYLNLFYKNSTNPVQLHLKGCELDCDLNRFVELMKPIIIDPETWRMECELNWIDVLPFDHKGNVLVFTVIGSFTMISLLLVCMMQCLKPEAGPNKALYEQLSSEDA